MAYATFDDVKKRNKSPLGESDKDQCNTLLEDAAIIIDSYNVNAKTDAKKLVSCRMVIRALGCNDQDIPVGTSQGTMSALGYSQTWTLGSGSAGELYLTKLDKKLLGTGSKIGAKSPLEDM